MFGWFLECVGKVWDYQASKIHVSSETCHRMWQTQDVNSWRKEVPCECNNCNNVLFGWAVEICSPPCVLLMHFRCSWACRTIFLLGLCFNPLRARVGEKGGKSYVLVSSGCFSKSKERQRCPGKTLAVMKHVVICCLICSLICFVCSAPSSSDTRGFW